jgi:hypothetical protein
VARITVEVGSGAARYRIAVQARSAQRALELAEGLNSGSDFGAVFPADLKTYSDEGFVNMAEPFELENRRLEPADRVSVRQKALA